jgi:uncharacterized cupredoxin-like copper-binding protein
MKAFPTFRRSLLLLPVLLLALAELALACGGDGEGEEEATATEEGELFVDPDAPVVSVDLGEFFVTPDVDAIEAGPVTFSASNEGAIPHALVIIKTDTPAGEIPVEGGKVDEDAVGEVVGEIEEFDAGLTLAGTFELEAGKYALICNIAGHYEGGMHAEFTVE